MRTKIFSIITSISMVLSIIAFVFGIIGVVITGLYPAIFILFLIILIPILSKFYAKKNVSKPNEFQKKYYKTLLIINLILIPIVLWMTFVIVHDRVLLDC